MLAVLALSGQQNGLRNLGRIRASRVGAKQPARQSGKVDDDETVLLRQIEATDRQIDRLVYGLYGLSDEEIALVERAAKL